MRKSLGITWRAVGVSPPSFPHLTRRAYAAPLAASAATGDVTPLIVNPAIMPFNLCMGAYFKKPPFVCPHSVDNPHKQDMLSDHDAEITCGRKIFSALQDLNRLPCKVTANGRWTLEVFCSQSKPD